MAHRTAMEACSVASLPSRRAEGPRKAKAGSTGNCEAQETAGFGGRRLCQCCWRLVRRYWLERARRRRGASTVTTAIEDDAEGRGAAPLPRQAQFRWQTSPACLQTERRDMRTSYRKNK